jgi:hypothetical protein
MEIKNISQRRRRESLRTIEEQVEHQKCLPKNYRNILTESTCRVEIVLSLQTLLRYRKGFSSGIRQSVVKKNFSDVSEEFTASIFSFEGQVKQVRSKKHVAQTMSRLSAFFLAYTSTVKMEAVHTSENIGSAW